MMYFATAQTKAVSPFDLSFICQSLIAAVAVAIGSIKITLAPFSFAFLIKGTRWILVSTGFLPQIIIVFALWISRGECPLTLPKSLCCAAIPAPQQRLPSKVVTFPR